MADYWRFSDRGAPVSIQAKRPRADYEDMLPPGPNYLPHEEPRYDDRDGHFPWREPDLLGIAPDGNRNMMAYAPGSMTGPDIPGLGGAPYVGMNASGPLGVPNLGLNDPSLTAQGGRMMGGMDPGMVKSGSMGLNGGRLDYVSGQDTQPGGPAGPGVIPPDATSTLYVEGIPSDCSRREAAHIFRPFVGFKEVRLVRKDGKRPGDQFVLCFVDFTDPKCASIALEALQGYKFDETDRDSDTLLRLQYSRFPGSRPAPRDGSRGARDRDGFPPNRTFRH